VKHFDQWLRKHQIEWRIAAIANEEIGTKEGVSHDWILPAADWKDGLWPGIREGAESVPEYLRTNHVQRHIGANNLKSSWIHCSNLYFPFRATAVGRALLAGFLKSHVAPEVTSVDRVELEYQEEGSLCPSELLGESGGARGASQTSPDVAFIVNGGRGLILTESKLAEHSFYGCSARRRRDGSGRPGNPSPERCDDASAVHVNHLSQCHQEVWGRKYWEHLAPIVDRQHWASLRWCAAARAGYQLFRQQALAEGIANSGEYELVVSSVAIDARNDSLGGSLATTGLQDVRDWGKLFKGKARFAVFTHQQWVSWVREHGNGRWGDWLNYVEGRYGYAPPVEVKLSHD